MSIAKWCCSLLPSSKICARILIPGAADVVLVATAPSRMSYPTNNNTWYELKTKTSIWKMVCIDDENVRLFWQLAFTCHLATRSNDVSNNATMKIQLTMFWRLQKQATILASAEAEKQTDADSIFEAHQQQRRWCKIRIFRRWQDFLFSPSRIDDDYPTTCACTVTIMRSKLWYRRKKTKWPVRNESKMEECWLWEQRKTAEFGNYRSTEATVRKLVPSSKNWRWCHSPTTNPG